MEKTIIKGLCVFAVTWFLQGCASQGVIPAHKTSAVQNVVGVAEDLMVQRKWDDVNRLLLSYVVSMPNGWSPRRIVNERVQIHYWDQSYLAKCMPVDAVIYANKPIDGIVGDSYAKAYFQLAYVALEQQNAKKAEEYLKQSLVLESDAPVALGELGTYYQMIKKPELAVKTFIGIIESKSCIVDQDMGKAYRGLGVSLIDLNRLDEAEVAFNNSLKYSPNNKVAIAELRYIDSLRNGGKVQPLSDKLQPSK